MQAAQLWWPHKMPPSGGKVRNAWNNATAGIVGQVESAPGVGRDVPKELLLKYTSEPKIDKLPSHSGHPKPDSTKHVALPLHRPSLPALQSLAGLPSIHGHAEGLGSGFGLASESGETRVLPKLLAPHRREDLHCCMRFQSPTSALYSQYAFNCASLAAMREAENNFLCSRTGSSVGKYGNNRVTLASPSPPLLIHHGYENHRQEWHLRRIVFRSIAVQNVIRY